MDNDHRSGSGRLKYKELKNQCSVKGFIQRHLDKDADQNALPEGWLRRFMVGHRWVN